MSDLSENQKSTAQKFEVLLALSDVYDSMYIINLSSDTIFEYSANDHLRSVIVNHLNASAQISSAIRDSVTPEHLEKALAFTDLSTLAERMHGQRQISEQFISIRFGWIRASFIAIDDDGSGNPERVLFTTIIIEDEKKREEHLIKLSSTDELTRIGNRRAYEDDMAKLPQKDLPEDLVFIAMDVNGLKTVNDTLGHVAGDELIRGSAQCIRDSFMKYGTVYRTGGDEFTAIIHAPAGELPAIMDNFHEISDSWTGQIVKNLSISIGWCSVAEHPDMSILELTKEADDRMYKYKDEYYKKTGLERRTGKNSINTAETDIHPFLKSILDQDRSAVVACSLDHTIIYMNPAAQQRYAKHGGAALLGKSLMNCHNPHSQDMISQIIKWFEDSTDHNMIYTFHNEKENKDVYMVALRDESGKLIGYYEKHEYRDLETAGLYDFNNPIK